MGFWIGVEFWRQGYATEAARALLQHAFITLHLNRVHAHYMVRNPATGRVLEKVGLRREGLLRMAAGTDAEASPNVIRPDDFAAATVLLRQQCVRQFSGPA